MTRYLWTHNHFIGTRHSIQPLIQSTFPIRISCIETTLNWDRSTFASVQFQLIILMGKRNPIEMYRRRRQRRPEVVEKWPLVLLVQTQPINQRQSNRWSQRLFRWIDSSYFDSSRYGLVRFIAQLHWSQSTIHWPIVWLMTSPSHVLIHPHFGWQVSRWCYQPMPFQFNQLFANGYSGGSS